MSIIVNNLCRSFGPLTVFRDFSLTVPGEKITALLGPSGCGKTTLLHILAGLLKPDSGEISGIDQQPVSYLFQEPRLLPWKTVAGNLELVLKDKMEQAEGVRKISEILETVELDGFSNYYPHQLSGGMRQRTAIARAFIYPSNLMFLDEPFQALDLKLRLSLMSSFLRLWQKDRRTAVFVTHDVQEALLLGDDIVLLSSSPESGARISKRFSNPLPIKERRLSSPSLLDLERELYQLIFDQKGADFL